MTDSVALSAAASTENSMASGPRLRASKPPFYRNIFIRHPVLPLLPLARGERARLAALEPCVIMGRGHSGTRVLAWVCHHLGFDLGADPVANPSGDPADLSFRHHQRVVASHALDVHSAAETRYLGRNRFQRAVRGFHRRLRHGGPHWGWKFPECYLIGPYVETTFPAARYLHLLRDGRDVAFKRHLTDVAEHRLARAILRRRGVLEAPHHVQAACSWALQVEQFEAFQRTIAPGRVLTLRYEELVRRPHEGARQVCAFLGVPMTAACRAYLDGEVTDEHVGQHRREDPALVREVEACIAPTLAAFGYAAPA